MTPPTLEAKRLERLERELRRLRTIAFGSLAATAVLLGLAAAIVVYSTRRGMPGTVADAAEARRFVLRDAEGRVRGEWGVGADGTVLLGLQGPTGRAGLRLTLLNDGSSGLTLADSAGDARLVLGLLADETASLVLADGRGTTRTVYSLSPSGASTLLFTDRQGTTRSALGVDGQGRTVFTMTQPPDELTEQSSDTTQESTTSPRR